MTRGINLRQRFCPCPITELVAVVIMGFTLFSPPGDKASFGIVTVYSIFYFINGRKKDGIHILLVYSILYLLPDLSFLSGINPVLKMFLSLLFVMKMFYLPYISGRFFLLTSDVGSILSFFDKMAFPDSLSIPLAVMMRFFPAFQEERKNIISAMKIKGITLKNPLKYMEYIMVPLLMASSSISENIARAAETRGIENPCKKIRFSEVKFSIPDAVFISAIISITAGGWIWSK